MFWLTFREFEGNGMKQFRKLRGCLRQTQSGKFVWTGTVTRVSVIEKLGFLEPKPNREPNKSDSETNHKRLKSSECLWNS